MPKSIRSALFAAVCTSLLPIGLAGQLPVSPPGDPAVAAAETALEAGHPWEATRLLEPALTDRTRRTPVVVLLAARAAAGWQGWTRVESLLRGAAWLDIDFGGTGRELLARSALARQENGTAVEHAHAALRAASGDSVRAERLALAARALEREEQYDSAAVLFRAATPHLPAIADWLALRAAGAMRDSVARQTLYRGLTVPAAQGRIRWTEALALTRFERREEAARIYDALGARVTALGLRLAAAQGATERERQRKALVELLGTRLSNDDSRSAIDLLDRTFRTLTPAEELAVARRAAGSGSLERAATGYAAAARGGLLTANDRFSYGTVLVRLGREPEAIAQFDRVKDPGLAGQAAYQRARAMLRAGQGTQSRAALAKIPEQFPNDVEAASTALYLAGDLATDDGEDARARTLWLEVGRKYPKSRFGDRARFRAAFLAFLAGDHRSAAEELDALHRDSPDGDEASASLYWAGRARRAMGDTAASVARWSRLAARQDGAYYATLAAEALGQQPWSTAPGDATIPVPPDVSAALYRASVLERVGLRTEARFEYEQLERTGEASPAALLGVAQGFADAGQLSRGMRLAQRAIARGAPRTIAVARLVHPLPEREILTRESTRHGLDPFLVAGLIRQESAFDPRARSVADARGLMQILPRVGAELARKEGISQWDEALLYEPAISIAFGTRHLADVARAYQNTERLLAAYNAGAHRVVRWDTKSGVQDDPTIFVERIPYVETRDYVRRVTSNRTIYRLLYGGTLAP